MSLNLCRHAKDPMPSLDYLAIVAAVIVGIWH